MLNVCNTYSKPIKLWNTELTSLSKDWVIFEADYYMSCNIWGAACILMRKCHSSVIQCNVTYISACELEAHVNMSPALPIMKQRILLNDVYINLYIICFNVKVTAFLDAVQVL